MIVSGTNNKEFTPAPAGMHRAVCVDVVDKGMQEVSYMGEAPKLVHKLQLRWQIEERIEDGGPYDGKRFLVVSSYTASLHEKSNLRRDLVSWRTRDFTDEELAGFDLDTLIGVNCQLNIIHKPKKNGDGVWPTVVGVMPAAKNMEPLVPEDYERVKDREDFTPPTNGSEKAYAAAPPPEPSPSDAYEDDIPF